MTANKSNRAYPMGSQGAPQQQRKPEWTHVSWWRPARWIGYTWARTRMNYSYGGRADPEYRTDKQMADEMLARLQAPKQEHFTAFHRNRV